jgi:hypothetical protein
MKESTIKIACGALGLVVGLLLNYIYMDTGIPAPIAPASEKAVATTIATKITSHTIESVYPLFSDGISWSPKVAVNLPARSLYNPTKQTIVGYQVTSLPTASTEDIGGTVEPLRNHYNQILLKDGWKIDINFHADGPGGSVWGFRKGDEVLILSYTSTFFNNQPDAPAQCPCTVVFTIIGGTLQ